MLVWDELSPVDKVAIRELCERSFPAFISIFFQLIQANKLRWNWHHNVLCDRLVDIHTGRESRVILNVSPGSTKTEIFSVHFIAWCILKSIAANRKQPGTGQSTRWLPISYADDLVRENSARVFEILQSDEYQSFWPLKLGKFKSVYNWQFFDEHGNQHRSYGTTPTGKAMGRRAGFMVDYDQLDETSFSGAMLIDDPLPTKDGSSFVRADKSNKAMTRVLRSRLARDHIPIIMVQQRICQSDTTDYLNSDKAPDDWTQIKIPAIINQEFVDSLDEPYRSECLRDTGFDGNPVSYWEWKEPMETLERMKKADPYMFSAQYQQAPEEQLLEGVVWRQEIDRLIDEGRAMKFIPFEPHLLVNSYWDLGLNDDMVIWLVQHHGFEIRLVGYFQDRDQGMEHYITWLREMRDKFGFNWGTHFGPHDLAVRDMIDKVSRINAAKKMGITFKMVKRPARKRDSIEATRRLFNRFFVDTTRCNIDPIGMNEWPVTHGGWNAIKAYRREYDPDNEIFKTDVLHNWASHPADALQLIGLTEGVKTEKTTHRPRRRAGTFMGN